MPTMIIRMAKEIGMDWLEEVFFDPEYQMQMALMMEAGVQAAGSQGQPGQPAPKNPMAGIMQNSQPGQVMASSPNEQQQFNMDSQAGANQGQSDLAQGY